MTNLSQARSNILPKFFLTVVSCKRVLKPKIQARTNPWLLWLPCMAALIVGKLLCPISNWTFYFIRHFVKIYSVLYQCLDTSHSVYIQILCRFQKSKRKVPPPSLPCTKNHPLPPKRSEKNLPLKRVIFQCRVVTVEELFAYIFGICIKF